MSFKNRCKHMSSAGSPDSFPGVVDGMVAGARVTEHKNGEQPGHPGMLRCIRTHSAASRQGSEPEHVLIIYRIGNKKVGV